MWNELLCWTKSKSYQLLYFINSIFSNVNMYKWSIEAHIYYFDILVELILLTHKLVTLLSDV